MGEISKAGGATGIVNTGVQAAGEGEAPVGLPQETWVPRRGEAVLSRWQGAQDRETLDLVRLAFLKLNATEIGSLEQFDFWGDGKTGGIRQDVEYKMASAGATREQLRAYVGDFAKDPTAKAVLQRDAANSRAYAADPAAFKANRRVVSGDVPSNGKPIPPAPKEPQAPPKAPSSDPAQRTEEEKARAEAGRKTAAEMSTDKKLGEPSFLGKVAEVLELFFRWTSPLFNLMMLYIRAIRVALTFLWTLVTQGSLKDAMASVNWEVEFKRALGDFAGVIFPPAGAIAHAGLNYWFDKEPAEQFGGLNYYVPGEDKKEYAFKETLDNMFGWVKSGKDKVVGAIHEASAPVVEEPVKSASPELEVDVNGNPVNAF